MNDFIFIEQLRLPARIGIYPHEKVTAQDILLDIQLQLNLATAATSEQLDDTLDYAQLCERLATHCLSQHTDLVETLAEALAHICLTDKRVHQVTLKLGKPDAVTAAASVGVQIVRQQT